MEDKEKILNFQKKILSDLIFLYETKDKISEHISDLLNEKKKNSKFPSLRSSKWV